MPVVHVPLGGAARAAWLAAYKAEAIAVVAARLAEVRDTNYARAAFVGLVYQHRAMQAFAFLADPDRDANIARYPPVAAGIPSHGATRRQVAENHIRYNNAFPAGSSRFPADRRHVVNAYVPARIDTPRDALPASQPIRDGHRSPPCENPTSPPPSRCRRPRPRSPSCATAASSWPGPSPGRQQKLVRPAPETPAAPAARNPA